MCGIHGSLIYLLMFTLSNMDKLNYKNIFHKKYKNNISRNPHTHWMYILYGFFILMFFLIAFSFYLFSAIKNDNFFSDQIDISSKNTLISRNHKLLNNVKEYFISKSLKMDELRVGDLKLSDPRLAK